MRIIGGRYKGRRFDPPASLGVRPTTDRAREALFNILAHRYVLEDALVLDGFAGSGAVSLEFASRGARQVLAVDRNPSAVKYIETLAKQLGIAEITVQVGDIINLLPRLAIAGSNPFDYIFFDPPYALPDKYRLVDTVFANHLLAEGGAVILEHPVSEHYAEFPHFAARREYSLSVFSFFQFSAPSDDPDEADNDMEEAAE